MPYNFVTRADYPVVATKRGKVRGYVLDDVFCFKGIPYARADRFMPPQPALPWEGIKNARTSGYVCPPNNEIFVPSERNITTAFRYWPDDEDCLNLNLWTPSIDKDAKKPVMVFCHGGGFMDGSAMQLETYEGDGLSRDGDVVVVIINHRLNFLGYLNLSSFGERYRTSGTVGLQDIVAALDWVQENISVFGGDPDNVTVFGQSGGGGKVMAMMQMPSAKGKIHKAIIQSGAHSGDRLDDITAEMAKRIGNYTAEELGLNKQTIREIETMDRRKVEHAFYEAQFRIMRESGLAPGYGKGLFITPAPDDCFPGFPTTAGFMPFSRDIPVMAGSCLAEWGTRINFSCGVETPEDKKYELLGQAFGPEHVEELIAEYRKAYPDKDLTGLYLMDNTFRQGALEFLDKRTADPGAAPAFSYMLACDFPINGGFPAWHCAELPMIFGTTDKVPSMHSDSIKELAGRVQRAWAAFAHTGDPGHADLPEWKPYRPGDGQTMIFDENCRAASDYDRHLVELVGKYRNSRVKIQSGS